MKTKSIVIGLLIDRIDVVVCAGTQALEGRRIPMSLDQEPTKWLQQVRDASDAIRSALEEMGAVGLSARVYYHGPGACGEYVSPRVKAASEAIPAAILACADSLTCPLDAAASRAIVIAFEKNPQESKAHVVVAADGDDALTAINEMVVQAGLKFASATPLDAVLMAMVAQGAVDNPSDTNAVLYVGEHRSFLVIIASRVITFARPISLGLDALVSSLTRPIRRSGGQTIELKRDLARSIVHECGLPSRTQVVHEELQLTGAHIIPLLQPVLQRYMVELRQSLRFALPEDKRADVTLRLTGPGSRTPGLTQVISDELGVKVEVDEQYKDFDYREPASACGELADAIAAKRACAELALEPLAMLRTGRQRQMQRWLQLGAAAAIAMIAFDALRFQGRLTELRKQADALQSHNAGVEAMRSTTDRLIAANTAMTTLENTIRRETGARVCMGAVLQELSRVTPPSIRLSAITFKPGSDCVLGGLSGFAMTDAANPAATSRLLETYMQQLGQSPLLCRLALANVQITLLQDAPAQTFDVSFDAIAAPCEDLASPASLAGASTESEESP